ncbi:MAG: hypothetical protein RMI94_12375, partial [Bryobacterales bacterium]|nr:hypothetical protein [Bryobacteraceae bacterium]MDW8131338.1 hypothetical protein [Bryobacterales bacterium]
MERTRLTAFLAAIQAAAQQRGETTRQRLEAVWETAAALVAEGFSALSAELAASAREALLEEYQSGKREGREEILSALLAALRRMQAAGSRAEWLSALADAAALFAERCTVFLPRGEFLHAAEVRGFCDDGRERILSARVWLEEAPAFRSAMEAGEPLIVQRTPRELSEALAAGLGGGDGRTAWIVPVRRAETTLAVLYADGDAQAPDAPGLELV